MAGTQDRKVTMATKSLSYNTFHLQKIRCLYGTRATLDLNNLDEEELGIVGKIKKEEQVTFAAVSDQKLLNDELPPNHNFLHKFIIRPDTMWKSVFDVFILFLVAYSCSSNILFITFPIERSLGFEVIYWIVEVFFYLDFLLNWFQGYEDIEQHRNVFEFKKIAERYARGWFVVDFVAVFPFQVLLPSQNAQLTKMFRLPRMLRIQKLFDTRNVKRLIKSFQGKVEKTSEIVEIYNKLNIYKLLRLLIMLTLFTYFLGCFWYLISSAQDADDEDTWFTVFNLEQYTITNRLVASCYYAITMLSTVGYGDMYPISNLEKLVAVFCMMVGVAVFSVIMEQFSVAQEEYEVQMIDPDNREVLENWLLCLPRFTMKLKFPILNIPSSLKAIIEADFNYH